MTPSEIEAAFIALPATRQMLVLASLAHDLTVSARGAYPSFMRDSAAVVVFRTFNELQHQVSARLRHLLAGDSKRYPDDVFIKILFEQSEAGRLTHALVSSFERALRLHG